MAKRYGKIPQGGDHIGELVLASSILKTKDGGFVINPSEATLLTEGWLPVVDNIPAHDSTKVVSMKDYALAQDGKSIIVDYEVLDNSDSESEDGGSENPSSIEANMRIADLMSQNGVLNAQKAALEQANRDLADEMDDSDTVESLRDQLREARYEREELLRTLSEYETTHAQDVAKTKELNFLSSVAAFKGWKEDMSDSIDTDDTEKWTSILCYGERNEEISDASDDETKFYKKAKIRTRFEFTPLRLYKVSDGEKTKWLVYTPPEGTIRSSGFWLPIEEAHGGDWVQLDLDFDDSDSSSDSAEKEDVVVSCWIDMEGKAHIGTKVPEMTLTSFEVARFPWIGDSVSE